MAFKDAILKKIRINRLADAITRSLAPKKDVFKVDKAGMRELLSMADYRRIDERDLELYVPAGTSEPDHILVLDSGLAVYRTTIADVALRKSPTVKEMISFRNVVKILKDDDVVVSKKADTVEAVRKACIDALDLRFTRKDLDGIRLEGAASLESRYPEGVMEALEIFAELLGYQPPPRTFSVAHSVVLGAMTPRAGGLAAYGPVVIFDRVRQELKLIPAPVDSAENAQVERYQKIAGGGLPAPVEGMDVFRFLMDETVKAHLSS